LQRVGGRPGRKNHPRRETESGGKSLNSQKESGYLIEIKTGVRKKIGT